MTKEVKEDLKVWECFLDKFNGSSIFLPDKWSSSYELKFYTDASGFRVLSVMQRYSVVSGFMETGIVIGSIKILQS